MKMPDMFYNQGFIYGKSNNPYEEIFDLKNKNVWSEGVDQNGNVIVMLNVTSHDYDCCCIACIDDDTVTEHLEWVDWYTTTQLGDEEE